MRDLVSLASLGALGASLASGGGVVDAVAAALSPAGEDYAEFDFLNLGKLFQDTAGTTPVTTIGDVIGLANVKAKAPHNAQQATASFKPQYQAGGSKFDGSDDALLTDWVPGTVGEHCIIVKATIPAVVSATQIIIAAASSGPASQLGLGVNPSGQVVGVFGSQTFTTIIGVGPDVRGRTIIAAIAAGANVQLFCDGASIYQAASAGSPTGATPAAIGGRNANGTVSNYFSGFVSRLAIGRKAITLAQFQAIAAQWA